MSYTDAIQYERRLDSLFVRIKAVSDEELQAHWARYLCILTSGYLETRLRAIFSEYAVMKAEEKVANFVENQLDQWRNPNMEAILQLTGAFSPEWRTRLERATEGELKDHVNSIIYNRHQIAHGNPVGITYGRIRDYYDSAKKVVSLIEKQCFP